MSYETHKGPLKKQRPLTATDVICTSVIPPRIGVRPKTAVPKETVSLIEKNFRTYDSMPLKKYEDFNDPGMDPVVVKAVKSFEKQKKLVTHETIMQIGDKIAQTKRCELEEEMERRVREEVSKQREVIQKEYDTRLTRQKKKFEKALKAVSSEADFTIDGDNIQISTEASANKVREEMKEEMRLMKQELLIEKEEALLSAVQATIDKAKREEEKRVQTLQEEWRLESEEKLRVAVAEAVQQKETECLALEAEHTAALQLSLDESYTTQLAQQECGHATEREELERQIADIESELLGIQLELTEEQHAHQITHRILADLRLNFGQFIAEVPGFDNEYFKTCLDEDRRLG